jgi:phage terminase large subunit
MQDGEEMFAAQLFCLGHMYNTALIAAEVNFSTYVVKKLMEWDYPRQYVREVMDTFTGKMMMTYGWVTDLKTRPLSIAYLVETFRDDVSMLHDKTTLEEMQTFVRNAKFRPEAEAGAHDDCVMALAIAYAARSQAPVPQIILPVSAMARRAWTQDMWDDYEAGSETERSEMIKMWGQPR